MSGQTAIRIEQLGKRFGAGPLVLDDVNLSVEAGEFVCLLGASGCGKSTLLNLIAGLDRPTTGTIDVPAEGAAVMFQESALMPWLTARQNVELALRLRGVARSARRGEALELLDTVNLADAAEKRPHELSGGMRQRVALARALAARPRVLLLDEPFGALDAQVRAELRSWLRRLHGEIHITTVFVTHDQDEAFEVADQVVVMNQGRIEQVGAPADVFERPANDFVMRFLGHVNVLDAHLEAGRAKVGEFVLDIEHKNDGRGRLYVRPHEIEIVRTQTTGAVPARVLRVTPLNAGLKVELASEALGTKHVRADIDWERGSALGLRDGDDVFLSLRRARVFHEDQEKAAA
jgi:ABC-type sulfate/molybdate transport systems ATPase subunit